MSHPQQPRCAAPDRRARSRRTLRRHGWLAALVTFGLAACADPVAEPPPLARLAIAPGSLTVSGISAGGYMAGQMHVAHSQAVAGAAILAAGPYYCSEDSMRLALGRCMQGDSAIPVEGLLDVTRELAVAGKIDPVSGLVGDRVWIFRGGGDAVIREPVVAALDGYYRSLVEPANIVRIDHPAAGHTFPTLTQVAPSFQPLNPNGCWDWWGYEGNDYATRAGPQIAAVWHMISDLGALPPD